MTDLDRRRAIALGGTALTVALAGCSYFDDTTGVPGRDEASANGEESAGGDGASDAEGTFGPEE